MNGSVVKQKKDNVLNVGCKEDEELRGKANDHLGFGS